MIKNANNTYVEIILLASIRMSRNELKIIKIKIQNKHGNNTLYESVKLKSKISPENKIKYIK